jgi:hypothetical protein
LVLAASDKTARFQPLLSGTGAATSKNAGSAALVVFVTIATALQRLCHEASKFILLVWTYGRDRVSAQHLSIVKYKPDLVVSNSDILSSKKLRSLSTRPGNVAGFVIYFA